ncbi:MAG: hypothetical protein ABTQ32_38150, partial [Myxococcaceae bacterium]
MVARSLLVAVVVLSSFEVEAQVTCNGSNDGAPCDDFSACTTGDTCANSVCVGRPVTCAEDNNPCTTAVC